MIFTQYRIWNKLLLLSCLLFVWACQQPVRVTTPPAALALNDSAVQLVSGNNDSLAIQQALYLWEKALSHDSLYFAAAWNKMLFENRLGQLALAQESANHCERIRPENPDVKVMAGIVRERLGDSLLAREKYLAADVLYKKLLNQLSATTSDYQEMLVSYAVNLKLLGLEQEANALLKDVMERPGNESVAALAANFRQMPRLALLDQFGR